MDPEMNAAPDLGALDPVAVANAAEAAIILAARGGLAGVDAARKIVLEFADSGDVTVTVTATDGTEDSGVVLAADIASIDDTAEDHEALGDDRPSTPPPMAA